MIFGYVAQSEKVEKRISITPEIVKKLNEENIQVLINKDYGKNSNISDQHFIDAGAQVESEEKIYSSSDVVIQIYFEDLEAAKLLKKNCYLIVNHFNKNNKELDSSLKSKNINIFSLDLLPRITRAQSMDILSSQANLAGYKAVIDSVYEYNKAIPMMMTAAGTVTPAKFFIIGTGVAGLQAIATAKRLGAIVSATDVRVASKEQVESLGGKFLTVEESENMETSGGYAKEASDDYKKKQAEIMREALKKNDIVICTALIPGKPAPRILTEDLVKLMKPGSIVYDLAAEQGGNSAFSEEGKINIIDGIKVIGVKSLMNRLPFTASSLYAKNLFSFIRNLYSKEKKDFNINLEDEIINKSLIKKM